MPKVFASNTNYINLSDEGITVNNISIAEDATKANKEIANVINISKSGTYEFTEYLSDGQISIDSNNINGDVIIILNNANIICKNAPAIIVFNKVI